MSFLTCCVPGCSAKEGGDGGPLHRFPNPKTDTERYRQWILKVGPKVIGLEDDYIFRNRRVCHKHFDVKWHYTKNRLCPLAIPTLHLTGIVPDMTVEMLMDIPTPSSNNASATSVEMIMEVPTTSNNNAPASSSVQTQTQGTKLTKADVEMSHNLKKLKDKIRYSLKRNESYKKRLWLAKQSIKNVDFLTKKLSKPAKMLVKMQITQAGKQRQGRRFTTKQKILALSLFKASPKAYRVLSEICILPKRKTLQNLLQKICLKPGLNAIMFENLKKRVQKLPEHHKFCTITFDEMAISPHLDVSSGKIEGFVDDGENREPQLADHALVFMIRGVIKKFKQPIQYSFCSSTTKSLQIKKMIKKIIIQLQTCGLKVVATVCDQGSTNMAAIKSLLDETKCRYLRWEKKYTGGFFEVGNRKIFPLFDPPHLMKGIRNNMLSKDLIYEKNGKKCVAKWKHIEELHHRGPGYRGVRLVPKLTERHVVPHLIPKMKVKHATQVFSRTVGVALGFMADAGKLDESAKQTADILLFFDELFDSMNGHYSKVQGGKVYRAAVTPTSAHHKLWRECLVVLKTMKYVDKNGKVAVVPSLSSWIKTIEGVQFLCKHMHKLGESSLLMRHFNQDPLENFFGAIRSHGYSNIMPTAVAFEAAYKTLLINNITSAHSVGANCEKDTNSCLQNLKYFLNIQSSLPNHTEFTIDEKHLSVDFDSNVLLTSNSPQEIERCAAVGYCSGWLVKNSKKTLYKNCATCTSQLESVEIQEFHKFIKISEYQNKSWLCYPTKHVFHIFAHIESIVIQIIPDICHQENILDYINLIVSASVDFGFITCDKHRESLTEYFIKKTVSFCVNNWCKEINKILSGKITNEDVDDRIKITAQRHYLKNKNKFRKRATGVKVSV